MTEQDISLFMDAAIEQANIALSIGELPVGAVIVKDNRIIARGYNNRNITNLISRHAEINAIENASKTLTNWRLNDCYIFVTLEPCLMCAGAIMQSRIKGIFFGAKDEKEGFFSCYGELINKNIDIHPFIKSEECQKLIVEFFNKKRK